VGTWMTDCGASSCESDRVRAGSCVMIFWGFPCYLN
jgi:hypothetical protein